MKKATLIFVALVLTGTLALWANNTLNGCLDGCDATMSRCFSRCGETSTNIMGQFLCEINCVIRQESCYEICENIFAV